MARATTLGTSVHPTHVNDLPTFIRAINLEHIENAMSLFLTELGNMLFKFYHLTFRSSSPDVGNFILYNAELTRMIS